MRAVLHAGRSRHALMVVLLLGALSAAGCGSGSATRAARTPTASPTATTPATPSATATPKLLYQADFSKGLSSWQATAGWSVQNGALQSDTGQDRAVTIPFQPATSSYAVEYTMRVVDPKEGGACAVAAAPAPGKDGYQVQLDGMLALGNSEFALHPQFGITIDPSGHQDLNGAATVDFELGTHVTTYRVEVRGATARVLVNGRRISPTATSTKTATLSSGPLTITCSLASARFSALTISSI
ncbi:MAG: hypothetical protein ACRDHE_03305 [Ktedonobacterales bacterium]